RQIRGLDFQNGDVCFWISSHELGLKFALVAQVHLDIGRAINYVVVREDRAVRRDDHTRAEAVLPLRAGRLNSAKLIAKELPEHRIIEERKLALPLLYNFRSMNIHNRRKRGLEYGGKSIHKTPQGHRLGIPGHSKIEAPCAQYLVPRPVV